MSQNIIDIKFAVMSLNWNVPKEHEYVSWLKEVKECGYDGITGFAHWGMELFIQQPTRLKQLLDDYGLQLASVDVTEYSDLDQYHRVCEFLAINGCSNMVYIDPKGGAKHYEKLAEQLNTIGELCKLYGINVMYHNHTNGIAERFYELEHLYSLVDFTLVSRMLDLGHATKDFIDLPVKERAFTYLKKYWDEIRFMEFKDWNEITDLNTPLGEGMCDYTSIFSLIKEYGYKGWITVEQNGNDGLSLGRTAKQCAQISRQYIREHLGI